MRRIVLAEYEVFESLVFVNQWQCIEFVIPDNVVCFFQRGVCACHNEVFIWGHELGNRGVQAHSADTIVTAGNDTNQFAGCSSIVSNCNGGVTGLFFEFEDIFQCFVRADVGITCNKACFVALYSCYHCSFVLDALGTINKGNSALFCKSDCHFVIRYRLHDCRYQRDVHGQRTFFLTLFVLNQWGLQAYICWNALRRRIAWN